MPIAVPTPSEFTVWATDKLRYGDTDRQGHVNNAAFATFLETGRVEILHDSDRPLTEKGAAFVIARLELDFLSEILWPGTVDIGTRVTRVGSSSVTLEQAIFQDGRCAARATTVIVQMDETTRRSRPLSAATAARLAALSGPV
ncbi:acyl-CoA thioesterase [Polymorphum gilvum]|uniref:Thioesterase superfamily protein n=1 Tax=Polymorphum gilvum (strain LMG 25793 / CGMCC 1.9160 / SL003B-26A1) TaxID=991905 RepID=F2J0Q5_POLGS|nr:thioesterase family protein [Polymorphum gilvum]ADZ70741.1 Thioesterase superfamily protein [Polymorphum gilvum SL003B-26A1]